MAIRSRASRRLPCLGSKRDCSAGVFLLGPVPGALVCFDPALGNRSDEESRCRLMQMLSNLSIFAGDGG